MWRDAGGASLSPCPGCYVGVVKRTTSSGSGNWDFTAATSTLSTSGTPPELILHTDSAEIISKEVTSFSPFTTGFYYNVILPVQLLSFTGRFLNADGLLDWKVTDTRDLTGFELQYGRDGRSFNKLADITSANSNVYSYLHKQLPLGANFYRLLVKDKNGSSTYSNVVMLTVGRFRTQIIGLRENPVRNNLFVMIVSASNQKSSGQIFDASGRVVTRIETQLLAGQNQWNLQTQFLARGMYFIQVQTQDGEKATLRFVNK